MKFAVARRGYGERRLVQEFVGQEGVDIEPRPGSGKQSKVVGREYEFPHMMWYEIRL